MRFVLSFDVTVFVLTLVISLIGHVVLIDGLGAAARQGHKERRRAVEMAVFRPPPPPEPEPPKKKAPKPPKPEPIDLTDIKKPIDVPPPPNTEEPAVEPKKAKPVFGISMTSVVGPGAGAGLSVRVGNTLMKKPEEEFTPPEEVKAYAAPTALHKVNKSPKRMGRCEGRYPEEAKAMGIEGRVRLQVEVRADGSVGTVRVISGLGYGLDEAAIAALKKCRFSPAIMAGEPVATNITYTYTFVIEE